MGFGRVDNILCEKHEPVAGQGNPGHEASNPADRYRCHYVKARVRVHRYPAGDMAIFHGPRLLASYESTGKLNMVGQ
ncbi:MAG: hypothetical protein D6694_02875 [Gammaproteobacteria bacterium]|nr:MAG: hypothetical protein D6694_02875 [Gammaproteobacteria bacterium]